MAKYQLFQKRSGVSKMVQWRIFRGDRQKVPSSGSDSRNLHNRHDCLRARRNCDVRSTAKGNGDISRPICPSGRTAIKSRSNHSRDFR